MQTAAYKLCDYEKRGSFMMNQKEQTFPIAKKEAGRMLVCALLLYALHAFLITERVRSLFQLGDSPRLYMYGLIGLSALLGILFYWILLLCMLLWKKKNTVFLSYLKYFLVYGAIMGVLFFLVWPGIFKGDEFYVLRSALSFQLSSAQTGLTSCFYIVCLLFFPNPASITALQLLIICCIFSYIMKNMADIYKSRRIWILLFFFCLLPILDGNLFTLRSTLAGWLFLLVLFQVFFAYKREHLSRKSWLFLSVTAGLVMAWRTEYLYLLVLLPAVLLLLKLLSWKRACISVFVIGVSLLCFQVPNKIAQNGSNKYPISLVINPLGNLFNEEHLEGPSVYEDILTINELIDVQLLRRNASVRNISQYWNIPDILPKEQLNRFMLSSFRLIVYNFDDFLKYRCLTFAHTNGFYPDEVNHPGGEMISGILEWKYYETDFKEVFPLMNAPLGESVREKVIEFLACRHYEQGNCSTNDWLPILYNCLPTLVLLTVVTVIGGFQKKKCFVALSLLIQLQLILIFLTAPAMFFMYYYCFYLCGYVFIGLFLVDSLMYKQRISRTDSSRPSGIACD